MRKLGKEDEEEVHHEAAAELEINGKHLHLGVEEGVQNREAVAEIGHEVELGMGREAEAEVVRVEAMEEP